MVCIMKIAQKDGRRSAWSYKKLLFSAFSWRKKMRKKKGYVDEKSEWWPFVFAFYNKVDYWLSDFLAGRHEFSPIRKYCLQKNMGWAWQYLDRMIINWIFEIIKPTFKNIISPLCLHLKGPSNIESATAKIKTALDSDKYLYCLRADIRSYYASINHKILLNQLTKEFSDSLLLKYLKDIVTIGVVCNAQVYLPTQGIPTQSALSPFFSALYLSKLDKAFTNRKGCFYLRYVDDILILVETKRQYAKARKRLFAILKELRLQISPHKTKMGLIKKGFHYLGVVFELSQNTHLKTQTAIANVHSRTPLRALTNVRSLSQDSVHPAHIQRYIARWAWKKLNST